MTKRGPDHSRRKSPAAAALRDHYSLARRKANEYNRTGQLTTKLAVDGIMASAIKHLRALNAERAKHYQKPLTMKELIEIIRESE